MILPLFYHQPPSVPMGTAWQLSDLAEAKGKQELYTKQAPQKLKALREHALIESAVSSNRIEGIEIDPKRIRPVIVGKAGPRDRNEEEVRGYRDALKLVHESGGEMELTEGGVLRLHKLSRGDIWDAGQYKQQDVDIIETYPDGRSRVRFKSLAAKETPAAMAALVKAWDDVRRGRSLHPLIGAAVFNLDFLCIHPFRDGNGRVSRLLLLWQCYHLGYEVGRYISLERLIEQNKERYYETLEESWQGWHEGQSNQWPYVNYCLFILKLAYREFEERVGNVASPRGAKTEQVVAAVMRRDLEFRVGELQRECPGVSLDMIRRVLKDLQGSGRVKCLGRGRDAVWRRLGK